MHVLITGATGFIGTTLVQELLAEGYKVTAYVRDLSTASALLGPTVSLVTDLRTMGADTHVGAIINLAGAPIADRLWTSSYKDKCLNSRVDTTRELVRLVGRMAIKPSVMISASAAGYYGDRKDDLLGEEEPPQNIFMSSLCADWEAAASGVTGYGVRLVIPRISIVLGQDGGAFPKLALPAKVGMGAILGSGEQYFPWIHKADLIRALMFALKDNQVSGPINMAAPDMVMQRIFTERLARVYGKKAFLKVPSFFLRLLPGGMEHLFLSGQRMSAEKLETAGFVFQYPSLDDAFSDLSLYRHELHAQ
ncbi:epimerase family protein YfcH [Kordiimonas sediminis]|uniref:Epimerase family protein YfcH n=1 Tax=Kordiimonas sediminis TaxID=1735581 RepID=A0A919ATY0_9PROT|nr:TIGR01777 family oxidoreductase [Kordiimonas sediminis]GHF23999.1 epimerase family protein YfcH [Kordiimonas sediminis]